MLEEIYSKSIFRANRGELPLAVSEARHGARRESAAGPGARPGFRRVAPAALILLASMSLGTFLLSSCSRRYDVRPPGSAAMTGGQSTTAAAGTTPGASPQAASPPGAAAPTPGGQRAEGSAGGGAQQGVSAYQSSGGAGSRQSTGQQPVLQSSDAGTAHSRAYVSFVKGTVRSGQPFARTAAQGSASNAGSPTASRRVRVADTVTAGEVIATEGGSAAEVRIGRDFDVGLGENTTVEFGTNGDFGAASGGGPARLDLSLHKGSLMVKAGRKLVAQSVSQEAFSNATGQPPLLVEIHSPQLFVSSRGGSLLVTSAGAETICAVGVGTAWVLPQSVVYSDIIGSVINRQALAMLDGILEKAVAVSTHHELTVPNTHLADVDKLGKVIRAILVANKGERDYPTATNDAFTALAQKATAAVGKAIGTPGHISTALQKELDPGSVHHQRMKTTSVTESGPASGKAGQRQSSTGQSSPSAGSTVSSKTQSSTAQAVRKSVSSSASAGSNGTSGSSSRQSAAAASSPSTSGTPQPASSSSTASAGSSGSGSSPSPTFDMQSSSPTSSAGGSSGSTTQGVGAGSTSGFPGPTPPTPPTPPKVP